MDRFESLSATKEALANELENISSAILKQSPGQAQVLTTSEVKEQQALVEEGIRSKVIDDLRDQLAQVQLEKEQEISQAEQVVRQTSETVRSLETNFEETNNRHQNVLSDYRQAQVDQLLLKEDHERVKSELEETRQALTEEKRAREALIASSEAPTREMAEIRNLTEGMQEMMSTRLDSMQESLLASPSASASGSEEVTEVRKRNASLEQEVTSLRAQVSN